jgi:hypothetical protein
MRYRPLSLILLALATTAHAETTRTNVTFTTTSNIDVLYIHINTNAWIHYPATDSFGYCYNCTNLTNDDYDTHAFTAAKVTKYTHAEFLARYTNGSIAYWTETRTRLQSRDNDADGWTDHDEVLAGTNLNDAASLPASSATLLFAWNWTDATYTDAWTHLPNDNEYLRSYDCADLTDTDYTTLDFTAATTVTYTATEFRDVLLADAALAAALKLRDSDADGFSDYHEARNLTNPGDATSYPTPDALDSTYYDNLDDVFATITHYWAITAVAAGLVLGLFLWRLIVLAKNQRSLW